jgi:hypothetical protein
MRKVTFSQVGMHQDFFFKYWNYTKVEPFIGVTGLMNAFNSDEQVYCYFSANDYVFIVDKSRR